MQLLPAFVFIVIVFLAGFISLQGRSSGIPSGTLQGQIRKAVLFLASAALLALFVLLFTILGKFALLMALVTIVVLFLSKKKA